MNEESAPEFDPGKLAEGALVHRLLRLVNLLAKPFQERFGTRYQLSLAEWRIMMALAAHPGATATELSDWTGLHVMNVSRSVGRLARMNRVLRETDREDRRRSLLRLSRSGEALYRRIAPSAQAREDIVRSVLSDREAASFRRMLDRLIEHLRHESPADDPVDEVPATGLAKGVTPRKRKPRPAGRRGTRADRPPPAVNTRARRPASGRS